MNDLQDIYRRWLDANRTKSVDMSDSFCAGFLAGQSSVPDVLVQEAALVGENMVLIAKCAELERERDRLIREVVNRNRRALEGDENKAAFNKLYDDYEAQGIELAALKAQAGKYSDIVSDGGLDPRSTPAVEPVINQEWKNALICMTGWAKDYAQKMNWTRDNANLIWSGIDYADKLLDSAIKPVDELIPAAERTDHRAVMEQALEALEWYEHEYQVLTDGEHGKGRVEAITALRNALKGEA